MSIYGKVIEHPEYPVEDARRFTVEIRAHVYRSPGFDPLTLRRRHGCELCGLPAKAAVHAHG